MTMAGMKTRMRMTTRTTRERGNGDEPLGRGEKMSQDFWTLAIRTRVGTRTRRNTRASTTDNGGRVKR